MTVVGLVVAIVRSIHRTVGSVSVHMRRSLLVLRVRLTLSRRRRDESAVPGAAAPPAATAAAAAATATSAVFKTGGRRQQIRRILATTTTRRRRPSPRLPLASLSVAVFAVLFVLFASFRRRTPVIRPVSVAIAVVKNAFGGGGGGGGGGGVSPRQFITTRGSALLRRRHRPRARPHHRPFFVFVTDCGGSGGGGGCASGGGGGGGGVRDDGAGARHRLAKAKPVVVVIPRDNLLSSLHVGDGDVKKKRGAPDGNLHQRGVGSHPGSQGLSSNLVRLFARSSNHIRVFDTLSNYLRLFARFKSLHCGVHACTHTVARTSVARGLRHSLVRVFVTV